MAKPPDPHDEEEALDALRKPYDASDPVEVNRARKKAARRKNKKMKALQALLEHAEIREVLYDWIIDGDPLGNPVVAGDPHLTYANLGKQNLAKRITLDLMEADEEKYLVMCREGRRRALENE